MGEHAHLLVGALAHSGRWRAVLAESEDFPHLVQALDDVVRKLGGTARRWRFDRMATVCYPSSGQVTAAFAAVAKYYRAGWTSPRPAAATANEWWRRPTMRPRNAGGARFPTASQSCRPSPVSISSRSGWTTGAGGSTERSPPSASSPRPSLCPALPGRAGGRADRQPAEPGRLRRQLLLRPARPARRHGQGPALVRR